MRPRRSDVKRVNERTLVLAGCLLIELIRLLEPGTCVVQVQVKAVLGARLKVDAVKDILIVSLRVKDGEFRGIEETAGLEAAQADEVSPARGSGCKFEPTAT